MRAPRRAARPDVPLQKGEKVLAWATAGDGRTIAGTRDALYLGDLRLPWQEVEAADWDRDTSVLRVSEVGTWGEQRAEHEVILDDPRSLLQLVRERITASVVLVRHTSVQGRRGVRVVARRALSGDTSLRWFYEYDEGIDPDDPVVRLAAESALAQARAEVGQG
jgi:hypothetical protein